MTFEFADDETPATPDHDAGKAPAKGARPSRKGVPSGKPSAAEIIERVDVVHGLLLRGLGQRAIVRELATATNKDGVILYPWGAEVSSRTVDNYIARATKLIEARSSTRRALALGRALARLEFLYRSAVDAGEWNTARRVQKDISELERILPGVKLDVVGSITTTDATPAAPRMTEAERAAELTRLVMVAISAGADTPRLRTLARAVDPGRN